MQLPRLTSGTYSCDPNVAGLGREAVGTLASGASEYQSGGACQITITKSCPYDAYIQGTVESMKLANGAKTAATVTGTFTSACP